MYEITWKVFMKTGNVKTYLLLKELEKEEHMIKIKNADNVNDSV